MDGMSAEHDGPFLALPETGQSWENEEDTLLEVTGVKGQQAQDNKRRCDPAPRVSWAGTKKQKQPLSMANPLIAAIARYLGILDVNIDESILSSIPKRYDVYPPLLLLPLNTFSAVSDKQTPFQTLFASLSLAQRADLYRSIAQAFGPQGITHIAINAPIAQKTSTGAGNTIRAPTGLKPLHGDFGRAPTCESDGSGAMPSHEDFASALWVSTTLSISPYKIIQIWAPLCTMFSRGNLSEKRRILLGKPQNTGKFGFSPRSQPGFPVFRGLDGQDGLLGQHLEDIAVVDLYVGIGYFALPYLARGVGRVWGFDLSPWAIEGCSRGAVANGMGCRVYDLNDDEQALIEVMEEKHRLVLFRGDNARASDVLQKMRDTCVEKRTDWKDVRHVNLGLLPDSKLAWGTAVNVLDGSRGGWVHVHENTGAAGEELERRGREIAGFFESAVAERELREIMRSRDDLERRRVECVWIEEVKTYAPGVTHCVFDIWVPPRKCKGAKDQEIGEIT